jgi:hypothetical protein
VDTLTSVILIVIFFDGAYEYGGGSKFLDYASTMLVQTLNHYV